MAPKKTIAALVIGFIVLISATPHVVAAKKRLPRATVSNTTQVTREASTNLNIKVAFRDDRNAVNMTLENLEGIKSVSYDFSYNTNGTTQGVTGTITDMGEDPTTRELIFGTCSNGICRYDTFVTNATLRVSVTLENGTKRIKTYILRK